MIGLAIQIKPKTAADFKCGTVFFSFFVFSILDHSDRGFNGFYLVVLVGHNRHKGNFRVLWALGVLLGNFRSLKTSLVT